MDRAGIVFAALIVIMAIPSLIYRQFFHKWQPWESRGEEAVAICAAIGYGIANIFRSYGSLPRDDVFWTLNILFLALFWTMLFRDLLARRRHNANKVQLK